MKGIVLAGPTGVGKTELSLKLAKLLDADVISCDSAQIYKEMNIGTAKIKQEEMEGVKHYMLDIIFPKKKYSVGEYQREVNKILSEKEKDKKSVILAGGTGLYINSIVDGLSELPEGDLEIRKKLSEYSLDELYEKLIEVDKESAKNIHKNNRKRVERALEVYFLTGEKFSILSKKNIKENNYKFLKICLLRDRESLYERINLRVELMLKEGFLEEVRYLYAKYGGDKLRKINIIGYTEFIDYIEEKISFEEAIRLIKRNSRRYAKRQLTWFKNDKEYLYFNLEQQSENEILKSIIEHCKIFFS